MYSAVDQSLNDNFFQNPAELSKINQIQLIAGNLFIAPTFKFKGISSGSVGNATSRVNNLLPYLLSSYRLTNRFVLGINITPSAYGHLSWPLNSIVANTATETKVFYYRTGIQSSYQLTDNLAIGAGLNLEMNKLQEIDFVVPNMGNQINKMSGLNCSADIGLFYKITPRNSLTAAIYTPVKAVGFGSSSLNSTITNNFSLSITEASVAYIGLQQELNDRWFLGEKIYWSGWSLQKNISFKNTTTGDVTIPTNWKNVLSYQVVTRYATTEKTALLGSIIYETNPNPTSTNNIGYPLAASMFISAGLDLNLQKKISAQLIYGYGLFVPAAKINTPVSGGSISANIQAAILQFLYKT